MKKTVLLLFLLTVFQSPLLIAQKFQDVVRAETNVEVDEICQNALGFTSTPVEIDNAIRQIVSTAGVNADKFKLKECSNIDNAIAKIITENGKKVRYIIYDGEWLKGLVDNTSNDWTGKFVLAHEIGHHLNAHSLDNTGSTIEVELEADYFAGRALASLGAGEAETLAPLSTQPEFASSSHPARADRIAAAKRGWSSVTNKTITIKVKKADEDRIAKLMMDDIKSTISSGGLSKDDYETILQQMDLARTKYYKGWTEDMRYYQAMCYTGLNDKEKAMESYVNFLGIENLDNNNRIKQISEFYVASDAKNTSYFTNPRVLRHLSESYYKDEKYDKAISLGEQFLSREEDVSKKDEINYIIAKSEMAKIKEERKGNPETMTEDAARAIEDLNYNEAFTNLEKAALQGYAKAEFLLAELYLKGNGIPKDIDQAAEYYIRAAQQDYIDAQVMAGMLFLEGRGVRKDEESAKFWFNKAYLLGSSKAKVELDKIEAARIERERIKNQPKPKEEKTVSIAMQIAEANTLFSRELYADAYKWYKLAADKGNAEAQQKIAWMYYKGKGVSKDKDQAILWWKLSAKQGNVDAINYLTRLGEW
ncbi:sel1 repeat family protein [Jejudonia soesokkakensis]|uniref:Sel1 repeat family protein n=1 Tax=Jejudonia soesokkakensis TaxID=1323432 RepID=A0ABW2MTW1_9FLAO